MLNDIGTQLQDRVRDAVAAATPLCIAGGDSKAFYGRTPVGERVEVREHQGIVNYEPTELVISARAGTPLRLIEDTLASEQQMLAFEPPHFGEAATLGGTIACNLSGPRRPYAGAARDFVQMLPTGGERRELRRVVLARFGNATAIGFVTRDDAAELGLGPQADNRVAVYFPMSYQIGGYTLLLPRSDLEPLDLAVETAMRLVLTGGMSGPTAKQ